MFIGHFLAKQPEVTSFGKNNVKVLLGGIENVGVEYDSWRRMVENANRPSLKMRLSHEITHSK